MSQITLRSRIINDKYTQHVYQAFDIQDQEESVVNIPINMGEVKGMDWNVGVIVGPSGSGKTSILNQLGYAFQEEHEFSLNRALISNFSHLSPEEAAKLLSSMGLSSVPSWLRPYRVLSNGEQYRARMAYEVSTREGVILVDEYTSVVDRDVAKSMSNALQKYIRKENKQIILSSCHYDILEWLQPDWVYMPLTGELKKKSTTNPISPYRYIESSMLLGTCSKSITI